MAAGGSAAPTGAVGPAGSIVCETSRGSGGRWLVALRMDDGEADPGLKVESRGAGGGWVTRGRLAGGSGPYGLSGLRPDGRITLNGRFRLERIAAALAQRGGLVLAAAVHSRLGDVTAAARGAGLSPLQHGDTLRLEYAPAAAAGSAGESWFAVVREADPAELAARSPEAAAGTALPIRFALHQNQPNPFRSTTTIRFDVPQAAAVRLEVYDLTGRRVRTLARRDFAPGFHAVEWDHRDSNGRLVSPGIYVYRLTAGDFEARRKMTLAP